MRKSSRKLAGDWPVEPNDLLRFLAEVLERLGLNYLVTGSMASMAYGEPRYTNDIDVVVELPALKVADFCAAFPPDTYYVSTAAAADAVRQKHQFNIIHPKAGLKIDVIIASDSAFDRSRFQRGQRLNVLPDRTVIFASPEDVIVKKMAYFREGGSEKHLRDIAGIVRVRGERLDRAYIDEWAGRLDLVDIWQLIIGRVNDDPASDVS
jgi:hypothetical protein